MWAKLADILLQNRLKFIIGTLLCTLAISTQIFKVEMSYESADLLPRDDSAYIMYQNFREQFGQEGNVIVLAVQDSNFFGWRKNDGEFKPFFCKNALYR